MPLLQKRAHKRKRTILIQKGGRNGWSKACGYLPDIEHFEKIYMEEHIPMAIEKLTGKTKIVTTKALDLPKEMPPFYRIAEIHFPSIEAQGAQETIAHAESISTGGKPIFLVTEEEILTYPEITEAAA